MSKLSVTEFVTIVSASFTRPADTTAYASGDLVANSVTAGSVVPLSFSVAKNNDSVCNLKRVRLKSSSNNVTNAQYRLHLYQSSPTVTNGDNGVWLSTESGYIGSVDITIDKAFTAATGSVGSALTGGDGFRFTPTPGAQTVFALLEARAARTPISAEVFTPYLEIAQN